MTYMAVPDISQAERATLNAGGEVMRPATHIAGVGKLAVVSDASGALIGLIQPESGHASAQSLPH
jgi:predicted enzyme related to lactoylglutathione lyase